MTDPIFDPPMPTPEEVAASEREAAEINAFLDMLKSRGIMFNGIFIRPEAHPEQLPPDVALALRWGMIRTHSTTAAFAITMFQQHLEHLVSMFKRMAQNDSTPNSPQMLAYHYMLAMHEYVLQILDAMGFPTEHRSAQSAEINLGTSTPEGHA